MATDVSRHAAPAVANATAERQQHKGRKPFSSLMKRLASLTNHTSSPSSTPSRSAGGRAASCPMPSPYSPYYPYTPGKPLDGSLPPSSFASASAVASSFGPNYHHSTQSIASSTASSPTATPSQKSRGPAPSAITATTATTATTTSTFSSPTPSVRSLTTTLTTIQSTAPGSLLDPYPHYNPHPSHHHNPNAPPMLFHHQFPSTPHANAPTSPGPTAPFMASALHPLNYSTATAGGLLTDNASIITLASSSKHRHRRHSLDTDASVRALAPSSLWGGSRESLPLSVLSGNFAAGERTSLYAATVSSMRDFGASGSASIMGELSAGMTIAGNRDSARRSSAWEPEPGPEREPEENDDETTDDDDTIDRRRSLSVSGDGDGIGEGQSMKDGSSNVGVWHGVVGGLDRDRDEEKKELGRKLGGA